MSNNFVGTVTDIRVGTRFNTVTILYKNREGAIKSIGISKRQLKSKSGVYRAHALRGAQLSGEFYAVGEVIPNPTDPRASVTQTQDRIDKGFGVKDFRLTMSEAMDRLQGELEIYHDVVKERFASFTPAVNIGTDIEPATKEGAVKEPDLNSMASEDGINDAIPPAANAAPAATQPAATAPEATGQAATIGG